MKKILIVLFVILPLGLVASWIQIFGRVFCRSRIQSLKNPDQDLQLGARVVFAPCGCSHFEIVTSAKGDRYKQGAKMIAERYHFGKCEKAEPLAQCEVCASEFPGSGQVCPDCSETKGERPV